MKCFLAFILLFLLQTNKLYAQYNLVRNYSFEDSVVCPSLGNNPLPTPWYMPTSFQNGAFLHSCSLDMYAGVPYNWVGTISFQYAKSGIGYAAIEAMPIFFFNGRLYLQQKIKSILLANKCYYGEFWISLHNPCKLACNNIAMLLTDTAVSVDTNNYPSGIGLIPANPQIFNYGNPVITDTLNWVKISGVFTAQGGEQYITIGNFKDDDSTTTIMVNNSSETANKASYYVDDIHLIPLDSMFLQADAGEDRTITAGDSTYIGGYINGINNITWYNSAGSIIATGIPGMYVQPTTSTFYVIEQTVCGQYSKDTVYVNVGVVPLIIVNYQLSIINEGVVNKWTTANEINVSHFNVQRSSNGIEFYTINKVNAKNKSYNEYSFTDLQPLNGRSYYRIEAVDKDGKITYSKTLQITLNNKPETLNIYPNPTKNVVNVIGKNIQQISIIDFTGRTLIQQNFNNTNNVKLNIENLNKGIYLLKVEEVKGNMQTKKLIVE